MYYPDPHQLVLGRELVAGGADLVVGSGPHVLQPAEVCVVNVPAAVPGLGSCAVRDEAGLPRVGAVLYSLGNFVTTMGSLQTQVGAVATVSVRADAGVTGLGWEAVASVPAEGGGQEVVALESLLEDPVYAEEAARLEQHLGVRWKR